MNGGDWDEGPRGNRWRLTGFGSGGDLVTILGQTDLGPELGQKSVGDREELDRVMGSFGHALFHLHPTRAAFGRAEVEVGVAQPVEQIASRAERGQEVAFAQAEGAGHAGATAVDELDLEFGDASESVESRRADLLGAEVAGLMVAEASGDRHGRFGRGAVLVEGVEIFEQIHGMSGDRQSVEVVHQPGVFPFEDEGGGRFGADDGVTVAHRVAQRPQVDQGEFAGEVEVAHRERGHARAALGDRHMHIDAELLEQQHAGLGEFGVVGVGEEIDEVGGAGAGEVGTGDGPAEFDGSFEERSAGQAGQAAASGQSGEPFQQETQAGRAEQTIGQAGNPTGQTHPDFQAGEGPVGGRQTVVGHMGRLGLDHERGDIDPGGTLDPNGRRDGRCA